MAFWAKNHLSKRIGFALPLWVQGLKSPRYWGPVLQWAVVGGVSLVLGVYTILFWMLPSKWAALSILAIVAPFVAMVVGQVRKLLLAVIIIDIPLQLDSFFALREGAIGGAIPGLVISVTTLALIALYILWLAELLAKQSDTKQRPLFRLSFPLIAYIFFGILSFIVAQDTQLAIFGIFLYAQMFLLYIYLVGTIKTKEDIIFIMMLLMVGLAFEGAIMIALKATGSNIEIGGVIKARIDGARVGGTVGGPNGAAGYLSLLLAPTLGVFFARVNRFYKWLTIPAFSFGVIGLILTFSRGGWLAVCLSVGLIVFLVWRRGWIPTVIPIAAIIVAIALVFVFQEAILGRLLGGDGGSAHSRIPLMLIAFNMIMDNFFLGVGINNFTVRILEYANLQTAGFWLFAVHNNFLLIWAETGTAAFMAYMAFLGITIHRGWLGWLADDRTLSPIALGFTAGILGHMAHMLFDLFNGRGPVQMLWLSAALVTAMYCILQETKTPDLSYETST